MRDDHQRRREPFKFNRDATATGRFQSKFPNRSNVPQRGRPPARRKTKKPPPALKTPVSGKDCRRMLKAAAFRLSKLIHVKALTIQQSTNPMMLVESQLDRRDKRLGPACRLASKIIRMNIWADDHHHRKT